MFDVIVVETDAESSTDGQHPLGRRAATALVKNLNARSRRADCRPILLVWQHPGIEECAVQARSDTWSHHPYFDIGHREDVNDPERLGIASAMNLSGR